jgi:hypothetical protein
VCCWGGITVLQSTSRLKEEEDEDERITGYSHSMIL